MNEHIYTFQKLFYENMGAEPFYLRNFYQQVEYLDEPFSDITEQVVCLLLGELEACKDCCNKWSRIEAQVEIDEKVYKIRVQFSDGVAQFYVTDPEGNDCTMWYLQLVVEHSEDVKSPRLIMNGTKNVTVQVMLAKRDCHQVLVFQ